MRCGSSSFCTDVGKSLFPFQCFWAASGIGKLNLVAFLADNWLEAKNHLYKQNPSAKVKINVVELNLLTVELEESALLLNPNCCVFNHSETYSWIVWFSCWSMEELRWVWDIFLQSAAVFYFEPRKRWWTRARLQPIRTRASWAKFLTAVFRLTTRSDDPSKRAPCQRKTADCGASIASVIC